MIGIQVTNSGSFYVIVSFLLFLLYVILYGYQSSMIFTAFDFIDKYPIGRRLFSPLFSIIRELEEIHICEKFQSYSSYFSYGRKDTSQIYFESKHYNFQVQIFELNPYSKERQRILLLHVTLQTPKECSLKTTTALVVNR